MSQCDLSLQEGNNEKKNVEKKKILKKKKDEKGLKLKVGGIVHWNGKDDMILSGFVKTGKEMSGMIKVVDEVGKIFYIPKDKIKVEEHGSEHQMDEEQNEKKVQEGNNEKKNVEKKKILKKKKKPVQEEPNKEVVPKRRLDIFQLIVEGKKYDDIIGLFTDASKTGFVFETLSIICIIFKQLIPDYEFISDSNMEDSTLIFKPVESVRELFNQNIHHGDNKSDITVKINGKIVPFSVKYRETKGMSDLQTLKSCLDDSQYKDEYSLGLIYKDDRYFTEHMRDGNREKKVIGIAKRDGHFYNEKDIIEAFNKSQKVLMENKKESLDDYIDWIDKDYLKEGGRRHLKLYFNQALALMQFKRNKDESLIHCLNHKPRSGKTIIMLLYAKYLLDNGHKRILIMTSVPGTINSFIEELNKYYEFKSINYKGQVDFKSIDEEFTGIGFCSVQYLKTGNKKDKKEDMLLKQKKEKLKLFDCNMFDECHFHSTNKNTYDNIINVHGDNSIIKIFVSGTSGKTEWFYNIDKKYIYKWSIEDEAAMKKQFPKTY